jgi:MFS family permease
VIEFLIWNGPSITNWFGYYLILEILLGLPGMAAFVAFITLLQSATPREFRGRVFSLMGALSSAALLVSVLVGGSLGEVFDPRTVLNATVALEALTAVAALVLFRGAIAPRDQQPAASP